MFKNSPISFLNASEEKIKLFPFLNWLKNFCIYFCCVRGLYLVIFCWSLGFPEFPFWRMLNGLAILGFIFTLAFFRGIEIEVEEPKLEDHLIEK